LKSTQKDTERGGH